MNAFSSFHPSLCRLTPWFRGLAFLAAAVSLVQPVPLHAAAGDIYEGDSQTSTIFKYTPAGVKTTFATGVSLPSGMAFDAAGNLYCAERGTNTILKFTPAGARTTFASGFASPEGIAFDASGNLFVADNKTIFKITPSGSKSTFATSSKSLARLAFDASGNLFATQFNAVGKFTPAGVESTFASGFVSASGLAFDGGGNLYVVDTVPGGARSLYRLTPAAGKALFANLPGNSITLAYGGAGRLYTATYSGGDQLIAIDINEGSNQTVLASGLRADGLTVEPPRGVPLNIATRLNIQTGDNALIGGFIITGSAPKKVLIRGIGPSLTAVGVPGALQDPVIELRNSAGGFVNGNDNWKDTQMTAIQNTGAAPTDDRESALIITLGPGSYTAIVRGKNNTTGIGLVEVYDLDQTVDSKLANISTRGFLEAGDKVMIAGFIVQANGARVLIRAIGPSLVDAGISNALPDPAVELHDGSGSLIGSNDDWRSDQKLEIQQTGAPPTHPLESAILTNLPPGNYTAIVKSFSGVNGIAVVEVYNLK